MAEAEEHKPRVNAKVDEEWGETAKRLLRSEMVKRGVNSGELAKKLEALGVIETERNVANKIARGGFTAAFFLQCLTALGASSLRWQD